MKKAILLPILAFALAVLFPQIAQAQGTVYVSTLGLPSGGSDSVGSDSWLAQGFQTGTNAGGYVLNSVQLALADALGSPSGFTAMVYNIGAVPGGAPPGSSLGTLGGSLDPVAGGVYTYSFGSGLALLPKTGYFIVLTAGTPVLNGAYEWGVSSTLGPAVTGGWLGDNVVLSSSNGLTWRALVAGPSLFSISATAVPEPSTLGLLALGGLFFVRHRGRSVGRSAGSQTGL